MMKKCAILTMNQLDDFVVYDKLLDRPMAEIGWQTHHISWHKTNVNWSDFEAVLIRSTWDYQDDVELFLDTLSKIDKSDAVLLNSLSMVKWNINKNYLREVEQKGARVIPTIWIDKFNYDLLESYFKSFETEQIIIKPTISANSDNTFWLHKNKCIEHKDLLQKSLSSRQLMIQPFISAIIDEGEYSLFYFAGQFSHCILKTPKSGDFRVQEEHGGSLTSISPSTKLLIAAQKALDSVPEKVLYARIDLVSHEDQFVIMEIELIEPSLYFNLDENAAKRLAVAFDQWMK